jgi:DNA-binding response OmpR family regulator
MARTPVILVIEDSPSTREQVVRALTLSGFRAYGASSAVQAAGLARRERPDLILADVLLPDMDGDKAASLLQDEPSLKDVPVVLMSALEQGELRQRMDEAGASGAIAKPFTPGELVRQVRRCLAP